MNPAAPQHVNEVHLVGSVVRAPEIRTTTTGKRVATVRLVTAVSAKRKQFHTVVCWEGLVAQVEDLKPGDSLELRGYLQTRSYEKEGQKVWVTEVVARSLTSGSDENNPQPSTVSERKRLDGKNIHGLDINDADLPF